MTKIATLPFLSRDGAATAGTQSSPVALACTHCDIGIMRTFRRRTLRYDLLFGRSIATPRVCKWFPRTTVSITDRPTLQGTSFRHACTCVFARRLAIRISYNIITMCTCCDDGGGGGGVCVIMIDSGLRALTDIVAARTWVRVWCFYSIFNVYCDSVITCYA